MTASSGIRERLDASVDRYRVLLAAHDRGTDRWVPDKALDLALGLTVNQFASWQRVDFSALEPRLDPVAALAVLKLAANSGVVLAAPAGDVARYALGNASLERRLADPGCAWRDAVAALG